MSNVASFEDLAMDGLRDIYSAETQVLKAFPDMIGAATSPKLKQAFEKHQKQTQGHVQRLEAIFQTMKSSPEGEMCEAAEGLIKEAKQQIEMVERGPLLDAALIVAAQKFEHYEIASYGSARTFAQQLGDQKAVKLLEQTLEEEKQTDENLTAIAEETINQKAAGVA